MMNGFKSAILMLLLSGIGAHAADVQSYALVNANVFNGFENRIHQNVTVLVRDGAIEKIVSAGQPVPVDYEAIDCEGNYLMPGLFDVHTHLDTIDAARRALGSGVTTVRSASVPAFQDVGLRELVKAGKLAGPDVIAAGVYVTPHLEDTVLADPRLPDLADEITSDEDLRRLVTINAERGVDVIKTRGTERAGRPDTDPRQQVYSEHQLRVIVDEAQKRGLAVMVHAHGNEGARAAVMAGARSIEHGTYLSDDTLKLMKQRGTWLVPTFVTMNEMNEAKYDHVLRLRGKHMVPKLEQVIRSAYRMGVGIATGADNYYESDSINRISVEIFEFVRLGMSTYDALRTATVNAAELTGLQDKTGRVAAGFEADLILLPANPLEDIRAVQDVLLVMSNGRIAQKRIPFAISP
jgi:imidazolonepropionase-like amidohydrolase